MLTAIIPARSGSKRCPDKNIRMLAGKPLCLWTLEACAQSNSVDHIVFSTDSNYYWQLINEYLSSDKLSLDLRSPEEAGDEVKIFDYLVSAKDRIFDGKTGRFMLCLPTMPLRTVQHIEEAIALSRDKGRAVFSAVEYDFATSFGFTINHEGEWDPLFTDSPLLTGNTRSQDQVPTYHPNGAIYIRNISDLYASDLKTIYLDAVPYVMDRSASVDIDTEYDFEYAECLINRNKN